MAFSSITILESISDIKGDLARRPSKMMVLSSPGKSRSFRLFLSAPHLYAIGLKRNHHRPYQGRGSLDTPIRTRIIPDPRHTTAVDRDLRRRV